LPELASFGLQASPAGSLDQVHDLRPGNDNLKAWVTAPVQVQTLSGSYPQTIADQVAAFKEEKQKSEEVK